MDLTFKLIILIGASFGVVAMICCFGWIQSHSDLRKEKDSIINAALSALISREQAQGDVNKAAQAVAGLSSVVEKAHIKSTPVKKTDNGKKNEKRSS